MTAQSSPFIEEIPWWRRWFFEPAKFVSPLSRAECVKRLQEVVDPWWSAGKKPAAGRVSDARAVIWKHVWYRNSFQTIAVLNFQDTGVGTRILAQFGVRMMVFVFTMVWFLLIIVFGTAFAVTQVGGGGMDVEKIPFILVPFVLAISGAIAVMLGRRLARGDKQFLRDLIRTTLSAQDA